MTRRENGEDDGSYPITKHSREQMVQRWPQTVLQPRDLSSVTVPVEARLVGYDAVTGAQFWMCRARQWWPSSREMSS